VSVADETCFCAAGVHASFIFHIVVAKLYDLFVLRYAIVIQTECLLAV